MDTASDDRFRAVRAAELPWTELRDLVGRSGAVAILPVGALEAHGPHLPLGTDLILAEAMADAGADALRRHGLVPFVLPTVVYSPAPFAASFAGTVDLDAATLRSTVSGVLDALASWGVRVVVLANVHHDPAHVAALREVAEAERGESRVVFPDLTRRRWAERLSDDFRIGCHAGCWETSILLASRPDAVRENVLDELAASGFGMVEALAAGHRSFEAAGAQEAWVGDPGAASAEHGHAQLVVLGEILADAVTEALGDETENAWRNRG